MSTGQFVITFLPSGVTAPVNAGATLLEAAASAGIGVNSVCGGRGTCGKCRARVAAGAVSGVTEAERSLLAAAELERGVVLLCRRRATGDAVVELRAEETAPGEEKSGGFTKEQAMLDGLPAAPDPPLEREGITGECYGIAVDMGTTSVAGYLADLVRGRTAAAVSSANLQRVHGADVISRITYVLENPGGLERMRELAVQTIDGVVAQLLARAGVLPERVYLMTLIGNTVMSHLLLGVSPAGLAAAPFAPAFTGGVEGTAAELGLTSLPGGTRFIMLPNIAGYVGSDTVGVILAAEMYRRPGNWLAVDVGTNGEIVLTADRGTGVPARMLTCSTAAGPAFEGARIGMGMRAEPGAIYEVQFDNDDIRCLVVGGGQPAGICGSGLVDAVAVLVELGLVNEAGRIIDPADGPPDTPERVRERIRPAGKGFKFVLIEAAGDRREVAVTQQDISELQLAKGAIRAGSEVLLRRAGLSAADLDGVLLAGAFGSNLRPWSVKTIGLLPDIDPGRVKPVGNAAGTGAVLALLSRAQLATAAGIPERVEHVELSADGDFQELFITALGFEVGKG